MVDYLNFVGANAAWFFALVVATLLGAQLEKTLARVTRRRWKARYDCGGGKAKYDKPFDPPTQLHHVESAQFRARRILNRGEQRLLTVLEDACAAAAPGWRVMAQVSLGEILTSPNADAYRAINSKRVDLLLVDRSGQPLQAFELQGRGHHLGPAATRDAIKKEALRRAGIGYVEVLPGDTPADVRSLIGKLARGCSATT
ncbi:MAG TPA: DUF2726 domain-containing protein [Sphingomonas sp.]|nr:DUF2726 domain-containing protein [Sphingomonas sp.]